MFTVIYLLRLVEVNEVQENVYLLHLTDDVVYAICGLQSELVDLLAHYDLGGPDELNDPKRCLSQCDRSDRKLYVELFGFI